MGTSGPSKGAGTGSWVHDAVTCALNRSRSMVAKDLALLPTLLQNQRGTGSFVELGADGISFSNTVMLEHCFGWRGVLIEANPTYFHKSSASGRAAIKVHPAVCNAGSEPAFVRFTQDGGNARTRFENMTCKPLADLLLAAGYSGRNGTEGMDFLSLHVEGAEEKMLKKIAPNFFRVILVEADGSDPAKKERIRSLMHAAGMRLSKSLTIDRSDIFLREDVMEVAQPSGSERGFSSSRSARVAGHALHKALQRTGQGGSAATTSSANVLSLFPPSGSPLLNCSQYSMASRYETDPQRTWEDVLEHTMLVAHPFGTRSGTTYMRRCCVLYPQETNWNLSKLTGMRWNASNTVAFAMYSVDFRQFFQYAWPVLQSRQQPFTVVTAMQDNTAPWEMFRCRLHSSGKAMRAFIASPLLRHWYTQNWDMLRSAGKRVLYITSDNYDTSCSFAVATKPSWDSDIDPLREAHLVAKVSPLPIGPGIQSCEGMPNLRSSVAQAQPLSARTLSILVDFGSHTQRDRRRTAFKHLHFSHSHFPRGQLAQPKLWDLYTKHAYVAAPASRGQDTYRFWETLALGAIPIVLAGPLDAFYARMPCVIVKTWANISKEMLSEWRHIIIGRFGERLQEHAQVLELLNSSYLAAQIQQGRPMPMSWRNDGQYEARGVVNHTCHMEMGGILTPSRAEEIGC